MDWGDLVAVIAGGAAGVLAMARLSVSYVAAGIRNSTKAAEVYWDETVAAGTRKIQAQHDRHEARLVRLTQRIDEHMTHTHGEIVRE